MLNGMGPLGHQMTEADEKRVDGVLADEMAGVAFMIVGTFVWAYGAFIVRVIS